MCARVCVCVCGVCLSACFVCDFFNVIYMSVAYACVCKFVVFIIGVCVFVWCV